MQGGEQIAECKKLTKANTCTLFTNLSKESGTDVQALLPPVQDIEDLVEAGKQHQLCPYFMARNRLETADMIFMPYSYVADPFLRRLHHSVLQGAVLVFDEGAALVTFDVHAGFGIASCVFACYHSHHSLSDVFPTSLPYTGHNIADVAAEAASFSINTETIAVAIKELDKCLKVTENSAALSTALAAGAAAGVTGALAAN